jgi:cyanophycinase
MADRVGPLIIIGGHEDKDGRRAILKEVARHVQGRKLIIATIASHQPEGYFEAYQKGFADLGVGELVELYLDGRWEATDQQKLELFDQAGGLFFTGGDQLRIASQIGDTPIEDAIRQMHAEGKVIAGTSAGASVMSEAMLVGGASAETHRIGDLHMAPGLGLMADVIIDQHFAERGRVGRLLGAVAHNPRMLGIGIDEDTAIIVKDGRFAVVGEGAVYIVDAEESTHSNIAEAHPDCTLSMHDVRLHVLSAGGGFQLSTRRPDAPASAAD